MSQFNLSLTADQLIELEDLIAHAERPAVRRRGQIILLLSSGDSPSDVSRELGVSRKTIYNVAHRFKREGIDGLYDRPRRGCEADEHIQERLEETRAHALADYEYTNLGKPLGF
jgi:transposase